MTKKHSSNVFKSIVLFALLALAVFTLTAPALADDPASAANLTAGENSILTGHMMTDFAFYNMIRHAGETLSLISGDMTQPAIIGSEPGIDVTMPAVQFREWCGDTYVGVDAPAGAFPAGTRMVASPVEASQVFDAVNKAIEGDVGEEKMLAVDITFFCVIDGIEQEIEPALPIRVSIENDLVKGNSDAKVLHLNDAGDATVIDASSDIDSGRMSFESDAFSVYVIVSEGDDARLKVNFVRSDNTTESMYVKKGDNMEQVIYDPGEGPLESGVYFLGWTTDVNYTNATAGKTIEDVRSDCTNMTNAGVTDGDEVTYYAMLFRHYRITYLDEHEICLGEVESAFRADAGQSFQQPCTVNMAYTAPDNDHHFEGWHVNEGNTNIVNYNEADEPYQNGDNITITGDIVFSVNLPAGHWFVFNENGKGATYNAPQFLLVNQTPTRPNDGDMHRNGYTFGGWYANKSVADQTSGGTPYNFNQTISDRTEVYARWIPRATAEYLIIIWKQDLDGTGYDFGESIQLNGTVGTNISTVTQNGTGNNAYARVNGVNKTYTGFHLKEFDQNVTINTEGSAVLNVYYDRNEYTLQFRIQDYVYTVSTGDNDNNPEKYGDVNGEKARVYWRGGNWRTANNNNAPVYIGTVYTRSNQQSWQTIKTITALYQQSIGDNFPIVGSNGITYNQGQRWDPRISAGGSGSSIFDDVIVFIEIMPAENITFGINNGTQGTKNMYYYVEALEGDRVDKTYSGRNYTLYNNISANLGYIDRDLDWLDLVGYTKFTSNPEFPENGRLYNNTVEFYYTRTPYAINYMSGSFYNGNGNRTGTEIGPLWEESGIAFGTNISGYNTTPEATHIPEGYVFEGWYVDDSCTQEYNFNKMPSNDITVFAKWREIEYRVFLHADRPEGAGNIDWGNEDQSLSFRVEYGGKVSLPSTLLLEGFELVG